MRNTWDIGLINLNTCLFRCQPSWNMKQKLDRRLTVITELCKHRHTIFGENMKIIAPAMQKYASIVKAAGASSPSGATSPWHFVGCYYLFFHDEAEVEQELAEERATDLAEEGAELESLAVTSIGLKGFHGEGTAPCLVG